MVSHVEVLNLEKSLSKTVLRVPLSVVTRSSGRTERMMLARAGLPDLGCISARNFERAALDVNRSFTGAASGNFSELVATLELAAVHPRFVRVSSGRQCIPLSQKL
jgi:hypothetical protein